MKFSSAIQPTLLAAACAAFVVVALNARSDDTTTAVKPVQARPPLQAVPTTPLTRAVQEHMRQCNAEADKRKLQAAPRETFVKSCMQPKRPSTPASSTAAR